MLEKKDGILQDNVEEKNNMEGSDVQPEATQSSDQTKDLETTSDDLEGPKEIGSHEEPLEAIDIESSDSAEVAEVEGKLEAKAPEEEVDKAVESILPKEEEDMEASKLDGQPEEEKDLTLEAEVEDTTEESTDKESSIREKAATTDQSDEKEEDVLEEIDDSNAEDAEDEDNKHRHTIPMMDYHTMTMEK